MNAPFEKRKDVPKHVPPELVRDLDVFNIPGLVNGASEDIHALWKKEVQDVYPDIFWTPYYGGHWVLTRYEEMRDMVMDTTNFSNSDSFIPRVEGPMLIPVKLDPPEHAKFRALLTPVFSPKMVERASETARMEAVKIIEQLKPRGHCEFVADFSRIMPIVTFLTLINLPVSDLDYLVALTRRMLPGHPELMAAYAELDDYMRSQFAQRREHPQDDFLTSLLSAKVDGRPLTQEEIEAIARLVISGGLDTVVLVTTFTANFLAQHPEHRRELIEHPELLDAAVEEFLRVFGTSNLGRLVTHDTVFHDVTFRKDDFVLALFPMAGWDERVNENPENIDFSRAQRPYLTFGTGVHLCVGNRLAKREIRIFLEEWLKRIPDFHLAPGFKPRMTPGMLNQLVELQLEWTPT